MIRRSVLFLSIAVLSLAPGVHAQSSPPAAPPQPWSGIARTDLLRNDLSSAGHEVIQARVDFQPGAFAPRHRHPGEETAYVLSGTLEYRLDGRPPVILNAGEVLFIPDGAVHAARNVGRGSASELATYVVRKGEPLLMPAE
jgi:quercetin dioxygenase-like cupin family protein